ncbi:restriction endonuclease subunit S [Nocardioides sp. Kera G14]|uniref:restriction endonuclease subunit S n=1 Tax=Nocardioides sp. Kera G14 TaxID=2884264 RepID=UPI001D127B77|nr:restriction endonuclease subunit S [Nocardioides sp. Kera G14]UDY22454.1 restriction endonuclease subunit S [Nocardioides sp. Kera G14]
MSVLAPWLPDLPPRWDVVQMRRVATIRNGVDYKEVEVSAGGYPVYGSGGEFRRASEYLYDGVSVLFGRKGTIDRPLLVTGRFWTVDTMFFTELSEKVEPRFFHYYALTMPFSYYATNTALPSMTQGELGGHRMPLPPLNLQRSIADFLDRETARIDALIDDQQRLVKLFKERRQAAVDLVFNGAPTRRVELRRLLSQSPTYGVLVPRYVEPEEPGAVQFFRVGDLSSAQLVPSARWVSGEQSDEYGRTVLREGDVLLGVVGKMGSAAVAPAWASGANVARAVAVLRPAMDVQPELLRAWLTSSEFLEQAGSATSGDSVQPTLGMADLSRFIVSWPSTSGVWHRLELSLSRLDALIAETERFIELSKERRAALITAAVTGQIDVRDAVA